MKADNTAFMKGRGNGGVKRAKVLPVRSCILIQNFLE